MQSYFLVHDYDKTAAFTNTPSPNGWTVDLAYQSAIKDVLGDDGLRIFESQGGLRNRSPLEIVRDILETREAAELRQIANALVVTKLSYLIPEISDSWPLPTRGFKDYWNKIRDLNDENIDITMGIVSSGHAEFIRATFKVWDLPQPDILISEDDIRNMEIPSTDLRVKPGPLPLALAYEGWIHITGQERGISALSAPGKIAYFGDDSYKDGRMADMVGVPFGLFTTDGNTGGRKMVFSDWNKVSDILIQNQDLLAEGKPLGEILRPDKFQGIESVSNYAMRS
ncbi:MAG TPA: hypothetical protein VK338_00375 [Candidatus Nitrosocosmicus sp.]|nr:hypothetical protein [Candidatus Nitrosocosmicus sp.]